MSVDPAFDSSKCVEVLCMACSDETCDFKPITLHRRIVGDDDLEIAMKFCGLCHSDLHSGKS